MTKRRDGVKRRAAVSLPAEVPEAARGPAQKRGARVNAVLSEALGLRAQGESRVERARVAGSGADDLDRLRRAFKGFSEKEMALLSGIDMKPVKRRAPRKRESGVARTVRRMDVREARRSFGRVLAWIEAGEEVALVRGEVEVAHVNPGRGVRCCRAWRKADE